MNEPPIRVLLADDHLSFRAGFRAALTGATGIEVVAEAGDGEEALRLADEHQPDVVVMDLNMPGLGGIEATRRLVQRSPHIGVLVLTMSDDEDSVFSAIRAGARGYLLKGAKRQEILRALEAVGAGEAIFSPGIARRINDYFARPLTAAPPADPFPQLTEREREVLGLMAAGESNAVIARRLMVSPKTVRNHASNIFTKLLVADRTQAILRAREAGLGHTDS